MPHANDAGEKQGVSSAESGKVKGSVDVSVGKSLMVTRSMPQRSSSSEQEQEALTLHVNLTVEQDKSSDLVCAVDSEEDGNSKAATRKPNEVRRKAIQGRENIQVGKTRTSARKAGLDPELNRENIDKSTDCYEKFEANVYGRLKRARKDKKQKGYIPWSDFGRISLEKGVCPKVEAVDDSISGTEINSSSKESRERLDKKGVTIPANCQNGGSVDVSDFNHVVNLDDGHDIKALKLGTEALLQLTEQSTSPGIQDHVMQCSESPEATEAGLSTQTEVLGQKGDICLKDVETEEILSDNPNEHPQRHFR